MLSKKHKMFKQNIKPVVTFIKNGFTVQISAHFVEK